jgi:hypothetical protein
MLGFASLCCFFKSLSVPLLVASERSQLQLLHYQPDASDTEISIGESIRWSCLNNELLPWAGFSFGW